MFKNDKYLKYIFGILFIIGWIYYRIIEYGYFLYIGTIWYKNNILLLNNYENCVYLITFLLLYILYILCIGWTIDIFMSLKKKLN